MEMEIFSLPFDISLNELEKKSNKKVQFKEEFSEEIEMVSYNARISELEPIQSIPIPEKKDRKEKYTKKEIEKEIRRERRRDPDRHCITSKQKNEMFNMEISSQFYNPLITKKIDYLLASEILETLENDGHTHLASKFMSYLKENHIPIVSFDRYPSDNNAIYTCYKCNTIMNRKSLVMLKPSFNLISVDDVPPERFIVSLCHPKCSVYKKEINKCTCNDEPFRYFACCDLHGEEMPNILKHRGNNTISKYLEYLIVSNGLDDCWME